MKSKEQCYTSQVNQSTPTTSEIKRAMLHFTSKSQATKCKVHPALLLYITPVTSENKVQMPPHKLYNDPDQFKSFLYGISAHPFSPVSASPVSK